VRKGEWVCGGVGNIFTFILFELTNEFDSILIPLHNVDTILPFSFEILSCTIVALLWHFMYPRLLTFLLFFSVMSSLSFLSLESYLFFGLA
jgi:hypothetical protein